MRIFFLLMIIFTLWKCNSPKADQGVNIGIRGKNGDTLSFSYFDTRNDNYQFYGSGEADSIFSDKRNLSRMPGKFVFGVRSKKGKPYRYLIFGASDTVLTIGKNYLDAGPQFRFDEEYSLSNYFLKVVDIRYDTTDVMVRENQLIGAMDKISKDTILYFEYNYFIKEKKWNVIGGTFAVYDNKNTLKEMKSICNDAVQHALNSMKKRPK